MTTLPRTKELTLLQSEMRRKGSDPILATARGRLQKQRSKLNDQINRELRMRAGAENLFKATESKKLRDTISLELTFTNSNLQLLKEELAELNSSVEIYQNGETAQSVPMIPLGLKETKDVEVSTQFKDFILEHYSEDSENYEDALREFRDLRMAMRTPQRNESGIQLLFEYYNHLYFIDKRFFTQNRSHGIFFQWYDSLTGVPSSQRSVGFEKGSVLFNIGALYSQIASKQDRLKTDGLNAAIVNFERAAGVMKYLRENFSHAPSMDMQSKTLEMLIQLMLAQAQECVYEKRMLGGVQPGVRNSIEVAQEAAAVSHAYHYTYELMSESRLKEYLPFSWISMVHVKALHYGALSHYYTAIGILQKKDSDDEDELRKASHSLYVNSTTDSHKQVDPSKQLFEEDKTALGKGHLSEALVQHEDALRIHGLCKQLRKIDTFQEVLRYAHDRSLSKFSELEEEDDFSDLLKVPAIQGKSQQKIEPISIDLVKYKVQDLFRDLGPVSIFNANQNWSAPRMISLMKPQESQDTQDYGFSVRGGAPAIVAEVETGSIAQKASMRVGDFIVAIGDTDTKWSSHEEVVAMIKDCGELLVLKLVTPLENYLEQRSQEIETLHRSPVRLPMATPTGSLVSTKSTRSLKRLSWIFRRKDFYKGIPEYEKDTSADVHL
ncbi:rhophilin-2-B-like isoform X2 [Tubulanus polymorphus]|uniref:rhophilin-2-B-like isoform X2 n=1 Tax=Tubulanus polymorphus TaxID=672921 RepID=UPI003DA43002